MKKYDYFMVFELLNSGERKRIDVVENNLQSILNPERVFVIIKEDVRRIYIWKGSKSPVRQRFISSRVASALQEELVKEAAFHRCKIVSVDQGDEPEEFLNTFNLESMEVTERLKDMRYIRNIEKDASAMLGKVIDNIGDRKEMDEEYYSPALEELKKRGVEINMDDLNQPTSATHKNQGIISKKEKKISIYQPSQKQIQINKDKLINKILTQKVPEKYERQNLIIGNYLYGATLRITNVFGDNVEEKVWEKVDTTPKGVYLLKNYIFKIHFAKEKGTVLATEILKYKESQKSTSKMEKLSIKLPENKRPVSEKILMIEIPENYKRENLIIGYDLYGALSKRVEVFGEEQEEIEWTLINKVLDDVNTLRSHNLRIYFNDKNNKIDAIEILRVGDISKPTKLNSPGSESTKIESSSKKTNRDLPEIPKKGD